MADQAQHTPSTSHASRICDALIGAGLLEHAQARRAMQVASASNESVVAVIHQLALADDDSIVAALGAHFGLALADDASTPPAAIALEGVSANFLRAQRVLPLGWRDGRIVAGVIDPLNTSALAALSFAARSTAEPVLMSVSAQKRAFDELYGAQIVEESDATSPAPDLWREDAQRMRDQTSAGPAVRIVDAILDQALDAGASDIHIEPLPDRVRVRLRVDGALHIAREEPLALASALAARIKVLAGMDIADQRSAQDGRTSLAAKGRPVDVRVSTVPAAYGETIALRLLRRDHGVLDLGGLGFAPDLVAILEHALAQRRGLFLISGPTGSGKTTTLYAMIERLRQTPLKILSIEDPVEYYFPDITQVQVNEDAGLSFPTALRAFLRQDPDVILVGEIRDGETARIAIQAALTGHLVLATIHTADAPSVVSRLCDLGLDRYLIAATLTGAIAQRLVAKLCTSCQQARAPSPGEAALLAPRSPTRVYDALGCAACKGRGVAGRIAVGEGFSVDADLRANLAIDDGALLAALSARGYASWFASAADLAIQGLISPSELRALGLT